MAMWNPWHGCHRISEGCRYCYIHKGDIRRGVDPEVVQRTPDFLAPARRQKNGTYCMKPGQTVYLCFASDFLVEDADPWRADCWRMMRERSDLQFLFLTKRITRLGVCLPPDWGEGYPNVTIGCTVENQQRADERLPEFLALPIAHRNIICQPMLGPMELAPYLAGVELVVAGGESDREARVLEYDWVLALREQCRAAGTHFQFRQCGTHFCKEGRQYTLPVRELCRQARKAAIDL